MGDAHAPHRHAHHGAVGNAAPFALALALNLAFVAAETVFGLIGGSMALLADAGHNFGDAMGLGAAFVATQLAQREPSHRFTYGLGSSSILATLLNAIILLIAVGAIAAEAIRRLIAPAPVAGDTVIAVALAGVIVNGAVALLLSRAGHQHDLNVKNALVHALSDAGVSLGVAASGALVQATGWLRLDPAVSLVITAIIVAGTWRLLQRSLAMALHAVPHEIDPAAVRSLLEAMPGVEAVHDLHIWPMSTTETALTVHLVMPGGHPGDAELSRLIAALDRDFAIGHATVQIETGDGELVCPLVSERVV
ncbi:MAG: cation transporter [Alphaproteobacteria bacterium]|nr:cation transporter [Alphaproteobacteria bacterium]